MDESEAACRRLLSASPAGGARFRKQAWEESSHADHRTAGLLQITKKTLPPRLRSWLNHLLKFKSKLKSLLSFTFLAYAEFIDYIIA